MQASLLLAQGLRAGERAYRRESKRSHPRPHSLGLATSWCFDVQTAKTATLRRSPNLDLTSASSARLAQGLSSRIPGTGHDLHSFSSQGAEDGRRSRRRHSFLVDLRWLS